MPHALRPLGLFAALEVISLAVLVANLAAGDSHPLAAAVGPAHGALYLAVIAIVKRHPGTTRSVTALSVVPAIGGALALRRLKSAKRG